MQNADTETHTFDPFLFDNTNFEPDYGTPRSGTFDSHGWQQGGQTRQGRTEDNPEPSALGSSLLLSYTLFGNCSYVKGE